MRMNMKREGSESAQRPERIVMQVFDSFSKIESSLQAAWDELVARAHGSLYLSYGWASTWWSVYGAGSRLRLLVCYHGDTLVGVMPMYVQSLRIGVSRVTIARLVGANVPPKVFDPPLNPEHAFSCVQSILSHLVQVEHCDVISIGPLSKECVAKGNLIAAAQNRPDVVRAVREVPSGVYTHFELPGTYDQYMSSLSRSERNNRKYYHRLLCREHEVRVEDLRTRDQIEAEFDSFVCLHTEQWRRQGRPGHFGAWPQAKFFNRSVSLALAGLGRTRIIKVTADGIPILYQYAFVLGSRCYWQLPARATGKPWERFSLGATAAVMLLRYCIEQGIDHVEAGLGHYDYKTRLHATESPVSTIRVVARQRWATFRSALLGFVYEITNLLYHKIWYMRLQPRMPSCFRRGLWKGWIRLIH